MYSLSKTTAIHPEPTFYPSLSTWAETPQQFPSPEGMILLQENSFALKEPLPSSERVVLVGVKETEAAGACVWGEKGR